MAARLAKQQQQQQQQLAMPADNDDAAAAAAPLERVRRCWIAHTATMLCSVFATPAPKLAPLDVLSTKQRVAVPPSMATYPTPSPSPTLATRPSFPAAAPAAASTAAPATTGATSSWQGPGGAQRFATATAATAASPNRAVPLSAPSATTTAPPGTAAAPAAAATAGRNLPDLLLFMTRLVRITALPLPAYLVADVLLRRVVAVLTKHGRVRAVSPDTPHRLFLAALLVAAKVCHDPPAGPVTGMTRPPLSTSAPPSLVVNAVPEPQHPVAIPVARSSDSSASRTRAATDNSSLNPSSNPPSAPQSCPFAAGASATSPAALAAICGVYSASEILVMERVFCKALQHRLWVGPAELAAHVQKLANEHPDLASAGALVLMRMLNDAATLAPIEGWPTVDAATAQQRWLAHDGTGATPSL
ncbi:hypothetical protein AMAG_00304 [Allomyces macrogynus ATCC 38327]|uniref:Cyclin N-terminal domain-containing protein n=1 Tax=Allomyces macrogynus (strain ATCC 38327) TaxID=578462 RepID=A0A0L0RW52_ALLM3|nr:hypothetical protein AMAG_00304 [Allomyces macrogynus ATCC 38327]|eukprot:KNE54325.1 hypothetical protein AMAG_00304 [Allomyces macrogynus ATCC 38327]